MIVESGKDIDNDIHIYWVLHYGDGLKNAKVCLIDIGSNKTEFTCSATNDVSLYHSVQFQEIKMILRLYYDIGEGITQKYGKDAIQPSLQ